MDDKEIVAGTMGSIGKYDVAFKSGSLVIEAGATLPIGNATMQVQVSAKQLLDLIAAEAKAKMGSDIPVEIASFLEAALGLT